MKTNQCLYGFCIVQFISKLLPISAYEINQDVFGFQCMSNCPPITKYFLNEEHLNELNEENPLGMKGEIAKAFGELIKTMWSGRHSYTMPHNFKVSIWIV
jgi:hypothetical protein